MRIVFTIALLVSLLFSKESILTLDSTQYAEGGYFSYLQFIHNQPGETDSTVVLQADPNSYDPTNPDYEVLRIEKGREKSYRESLWGICKNGEIFIAVKGKSLFSTSFRKLNVRPYYGFYSDWYSVSPMVTGGSMSDPSQYQENFYLMDMKTGESSALTKPLMREILRKEDQELYHAFLADDDGSRKLLDYLEMLNNRLSNK